jgi:hypothetical protein
MTDRSMEEPEDDVAEQSRSLLADADSDEPAGLEDEPPLDVNEADAAEQERAVELDEDEYR